MSTFLKIVLLVLLVVLIGHLWPIALVPFAIVGLAMLVLGAITAGGAAIVLGIGFSLLGVVLALVLSVATALSPIWIPVVILLGLISLCRRKGPAAV